MNQVFSQTVEDVKYLLQKVCVCVCVSWGGVPNKITLGAGCGNITVLAASNASGKAIDPLNIFTGRNFHSSWKGKSHLPSTVYGVSDNG